MKSTDVLVIGSGIAGLSFALEAAARGHVTIITKRGLRTSNTAWAQGGIATVLDPEDSFDAHVEDTLTTGGGLSDPAIVRAIVEAGPKRFAELVELGARFSRKPDGSYDLTTEGGHSARRVIHAGDITGHEVQRALSDAALDHPNITVLEEHMAVDLIELSRLRSPLSDARRVVGAYVLDVRADRVETIVAPNTVLATGGAGKAYLYTSNPDVATGDGVAMGYRAGAEVANMEFFQFHPTCLYHPQARTFLISEALRGEGGVLRLEDGTAFMERHHELKDLAPRDVVARAIDFEIKRTGHPCVYLDMSVREPEYLVKRFPNIHQTCLKYGVDMTQGPIPVVPAAHYMCGGVRVDDRGKTSVPGLWAIGEVSCSGLHGANRLASNSLLEGLVYGHWAAQAIAESTSDASLPEVPRWDEGEAVTSDEAVVVAQNWDEVRRFMWNYVGIVRTDKRLARAQRRVANLQEEIKEYYWRYRVTRDALELRNLATVAELIIECAMQRKESRGLHYTLDYPDTLATFAHDTIVQRL